MPVQTDAAPPAGRALSPPAARVYFAHQSVGANLLESLPGQYDGGRLPVLDPRDPRPAGAGYLLHERVGQNGDPRSKLAAFAAALRAGLGRDVDRAGLKFCYTDIDETTDVAALFAEYRQTIDALEREFPGVTFFHVTVPLTTVEGQAGGFVRHLLGRGSARGRNAARTAFNRLLLAEYGSRGTVFDLAAAQSTRPDGSRATFRRAGDLVPALVPEYTDDGGHLNATGRAIVGRRFAEFLAGSPG